MELSVIGISHHTAPVEIRERLALPGELAAQLLRTVHTENVLEEAMVLDTCNRTEVYFVSRSREDLLAYVVDRISRVRNELLDVDKSHFYRHDGAAAAGHLFRVAASLESQIVGEYEILGQVKTAYALAVEARTARFFLNKLLHWAIRVGKRVRTETELGRGSTSVAQATVELAGQVFSDLSDKTVLVVGAGDTARIAAHRLVRSGIRRIVLANRTPSRAQELIDAITSGQAANGTRPSESFDDEDVDPEQVKCPALLRLLADRGHGREVSVAPAPDPETRVAELSEIPTIMSEVDLVICSTSSPDTVLTYDELNQVIRERNRLLFIADIAVPRDVDERLGELPNVFLHNMNDLDQVVAQNIDRRRQEVPLAEGIVTHEMERFVKWCNSLEVTSTIKLLQQRFALLRDAEMKRYARKFCSDDREQLDRFTSGLCRKMLHQPIAFLRMLSEDAAVSDRLAGVESVRHMFDLDVLENGE